MDEDGERRWPAGSSLLPEGSDQGGTANGVTAVQIRLCEVEGFLLLVYHMKETPDRIARVRGTRLLKVKEPTSRTIPGEEIPASPDDKGWMQNIQVVNKLKLRPILR